MTQSPPQAERLKVLRSLMKKNKVEAILVTSPANRRYYSGFEAADGMINDPAEPC